MSSSRTSTQKLLEIFKPFIQEAIERQSNMHNALLISASIKLEEVIASVKNMKPLLSVKLAKNISEEIGIAVAKNLPSQCQLILDAEMSEQVVVAIASNMRPLSRLVFPATMPQGVTIKGVNALGAAREIYLCHDMPQHVALETIKSLPKRCFFAIDANMSPEYVKMLVSNLLAERAVNLDLNLPKNVVAAVRQFLPAGCWTNEHMISNPDTSERVSLLQVMSSIDNDSQNNHDATATNSQFRP